MGTFNILQHLAFLYNLRSQRTREKALVLNPLISKLSENQAFVSVYVSEAVVSELRLPASEGSIRPVCQELPLLSFRQLPILPPSPSQLGHETHHCMDTPSHESHRGVLTLCIMHLLRALLLGGGGCSFWQSLSVSLHHTPSRRKNIISDHSAQHQHQVTLTGNHREDGKPR